MCCVEGTLIAELDHEDDSGDDIPAPASVFSNHSVSSRPSPSHREHSRQMFSPESVHSDKDSKIKKDRKSNPPVKMKRQQRKSESEYSGEKQGDLVHTDSRGFITDRILSNDPLSMSSRSSGGINIGDEAPINMLESPNGEDLTELVALQRKLMTIKDPAILVKVVMLIQEVGKFKIGESTFDFDLCTLDSSTVQQIRTYLSSC